MDRVTGEARQIPLPEFDPYYSVTGFATNAEYCGVFDDGKKVSAIIVQLGRHKPR